MADAGLSVLAKLKNKAAESGRSYQLCLQLFCQEEFLRRLAKSRYADNVVLKGGLFLYARTNFDSRVTADVDFLLCRQPGTPDSMREMIGEIIAADTGNAFITFEIGRVLPISAERKYPGLSVAMVARIKNTRTPFSIDFGIGDVIVPHREKRPLPTQLPGFVSPDVSTYSLETTVAEKLDAALSLMAFSSRMKDYYDLFYLAGRFDFDGPNLTSALRETFKNRGRHYTIERFEQLAALGADEGMRSKWQAFARKIGGQAADFQTVMACVRQFLAKPFAAALGEKALPGTWRAGQNGWG